MSKGYKRKNQPLDPQVQALLDSTNPSSSRFYRPLPYRKLATICKEVSKTMPTVLVARLGDPELPEGEKAIKSVMHSSDLDAILDFLESVSRVLDHQLQRYVETLIQRIAKLMYEADLEMGIVAAAGDRVFSLAESGNPVEAAAAFSGILRFLDAVRRIDDPHMAQGLTQSLVPAFNALVKRLGAAGARHLPKAILQRAAEFSVRLQNAMSGDGAALRKVVNGPGHLSASKKPRHGNDDANIANIKVHPTVGELYSRMDPYLPQNAPGGSKHLQLGTPEALLDVNFRLYRHDFVAPLGDGLKAFRNRGGLRSLGPRDVKFAVRGQGAAAADFSMRVFRNVSYCRLNRVRIPGVGPSYEFHFDELPQVAAECKSLQERADYWEESSSLLSSGHYVLLYWEVMDADGKPMPQFEFAEVNFRFDEPMNPKFKRGKSSRHPEDPGMEPQEQALTMVVTPSGRPRVRIGLSLKRSLTSKLAAALGDPDIEVVLLQNKTVFYAYEPVLHTLQTKALPLWIDRYIRPAKLSRAEQKDLEARSTPGYMTVSQSPFWLDLRCLATPGAAPEDVMRLARVVVSDRGQFGALLPVLERAARLDAAQCRAMQAALTQELSLIQGPPGTGKTFLGSLIVQVLLSNRANIERQLGAPMGPVVIISYTNHAIDQFLENLLKKGIRSLVRMGKTKSEVLEPFLLSNLTRNKSEAPAAEATRKLAGNAFRRGDVINDDLRAAALAVKDLMRSGPLESLAARLRTAAPDFYARVVRTVPRKGAATATAMVDFFNQKHCTSVAVPHTRPVADLLRLPNPWMTSAGERKLLLTWAKDVARQVAGSAEDLLDDDAGPGQGAAEAEEFARLAFADQSAKEVEATLRGLYADKKLDVLRKAEVVGVTTTSAAANESLIRALSPRFLLVEEAAEVFEAHILAAMGRSTEQMILIGDHLQLRPKPTVYSLTAESGKKKDLDISMFERLIYLQGIPHVTLETQWRMRPEVSRLVRETIYPSLGDSETVRRYPPTEGMAKSVFFLDHGGRWIEGAPDALDDDSTSKCNHEEARFAVRLARYLHQQTSYKEPEQITILCTYLAQARLVQELAMAEFSISMNDRDLAELDVADFDGPPGAGQTAPKGGAKGATGTKSDDRAALLKAIAKAKGEIANASGQKRAANDPGAAPVLRKSKPKKSIRVATVDNFQGEESDIIILSLVRSNPANRPGFLNIRNRANVALSRAKQGLFILGDAALLRAGASPQSIWPQVLSILAREHMIGPALPLHCAQHNVTTWVKSVEELDAQGRNGGCTAPCGAKLRCGHLCEATCHPGDPRHQLFVCRRACNKALACGHKCTKLCGEPCGSCDAVVQNIPLPCGHTLAQGACYIARNPVLYTCPEPAQEPVALPCGHALRVTCGMRAKSLEDLRLGRLKCTAKCSAVFVGCGHVCKARCGACVRDGQGHEELCPACRAK